MTFISVIAATWLLVSASVGFWVAHTDLFERGKGRETSQKFAYHFLVQPSAVVAINLALGWQVALASGLLMNWVLRWVGLGLRDDRRGLDKHVHRYFALTYFGFCILTGNPEPLRYFLLIALILALGSGDLVRDEHFRKQLDRFGPKARSALIWALFSMIVLFLCLVEVVWCYRGIEVWIWIYSYSSLLLMGLVVSITTFLAPYFPSEAE